MSDFLTKVFGSSWRTTIGGYVVAILLGVTSYVQSGHALNFKDPLLWAAVGVAIKGNFEKDKAITGGTTLASNAVPDATLHAQANQVAAVEGTK